MKGQPKARHWLAQAMLGMTAQAVFPDMRKPGEPVVRERTDNEERQAAAVAKRERKNQQRKGAR